MSPIEELSRPKGYAGGDNGWTVLANNARVNKSWEALMEEPRRTHRSAMNTFVRSRCSPSVGGSSR
jgi:hypothetical protein